MFDMSREEKLITTMRKVRCVCPKCGGNIADRVVVTSLLTNKRYTAIRCRNCEHEWNIK